MMKIKLMADYGCDPLGKQPPDSIGNLPPEALPISDSLRAALHEWAFEYDRTLDASDPTNSGFRSQEAADTFIAAGHALASRLRGELGDGYELTYIPNAVPKRGTA